MLVLIVLLVIFGLAVLFSSSEYNGRVRFGDSACYFKKQLFATALGMGVMYMVSSIDYHFFLRLGPVAYLISMFLSGAVLFVGQEINGSKRWLNLGPLSFQPSEFAKVAVILFLAWQIERTKKATMGFGFMCRTISCPSNLTHSPSRPDAFSRTSAPSALSAIRWKSIGLFPIVHPPGYPILHFLFLASTAPARIIEERILPV